MSIATTAPAPAGVLDRVERTAWRVPLPTRRFFVAVALVTAVASGLSGIAAGWVASRNAATLAEARQEGLDLATAVTEFRTRLASADARAAATLISRGLEDPESRALYDGDLLTASHALTDAGLVGTDDDRADIQAMADGLLDYAGLVETSRANSRQGLPVGAAYLDEALSLADDTLVPLAERRRSVGERRIALAVNSIGGPASALAVVALVAGLATVVVGAALVAGRTRRVIAHPALLLAVVVMLGVVGLMANSIATQTRELRRAATGDVDAYLAANEVSSQLSDLRVIEIAAVAARGSGGEHYDRFAVEAGDLATALTEAPGDTGDLADLHAAVTAYAAAVTDEVRPTDEKGDNREASALVLTTSAEAYTAASALAAANVDAAVADLTERFAAAGDADVQPLLPVVLGGAAAVLAATGTLARGRRYR